MSLRETLRRIRLNRKRSVLHNKHPFWNKFFFALELVMIPFVLWWVPYGHLPNAGWAVAFIAVAAAAMSVHDKMTGWQKAVWLVIIGGLLTTELRAINKDRLDNQRQALSDRQAQDTAFDGVRQAQNKDFAATASDLTTAISGIKSTLTAANTTILQTQSHAFFGATRMELSGMIGPNSLASYKAWVSNTGNEKADKAYIFSHSYIGDASDSKTQDLLHRQFEQDWKAQKHRNRQDMWPGAPENDHFNLPKVDQTESRALAEGRLSIYFFTRVSYYERGQEFHSDSCESMTFHGVPKDGEADSDICRVEFDNKRHRPHSD